MLTESVPRLWIYNAGIDKVWQTEKQGMKKINNPKEQVILNSQSELLIFLCEESDYLVLFKIPDSEFIKDMIKFGIKKPKFIQITEGEKTISELFSYEMDNIDELKNEKVNGIIYTPYILSFQDENNAKKLKIPIYGKNYEIVKKINNKTFIREISLKYNFPTIKGFICRSKEELLTSANLLIKRGCKKFCIKEPFNSAGKGVFFIRDEKQLNLFSNRIQFEGEDFSVVLEEWIDNKKDINYQIEILKNGNINFIGITEQIINITSYKGTVYPANISLEQENQYKVYAKLIGDILYKMGFIGIVGVDSMITSDNTIIPMIEINARINQSTFYLKLGNYFHKKNKKTIFRSYDINTDIKLNYLLLKQYLISHDLYFDGERGSIIINSSCLSIYINNDGTYFSRVYLAYIDESMVTNEQLMSSIDKVIEIIKEI